MRDFVPLEYGQYYHIYNRGNNGENIFIEERNYSYFLRLCVKYIEPIADTLAYVLLRNHFHLLVRIKDPSRPGRSDRPARSPKSPTQQFSNLFNSYAKSINKAYGRTGSLFQKRFGRILVTSDAHFAALVRYIHFNPQKHGFVSDFREYPYSSYQAMLSDQATRLRRDVVLEWFGDRASFVEFHRDLPGLTGLAGLVDDDD
jgi:REP element-mobilizing transposase RayT